MEVLKIVNNKNFLKNVENTGKYFIEKLKELQKSYSIIKEVRGQGLIIGIELNTDGKEIVKKCLQKGLIINCTQDKVLRFLPPLIISKKDVDEVISVLKDALK